MARRAAPGQSGERSVRAHEARPDGFAIPEFLSTVKAFLERKEK